MFYEIKLKVEKENSKGEKKEVKEYFITDVELFAEAEMTAMQQYNGDCDVFAIFRSKIREIVNKKEDDKPFFKATIVDVFVNDDGTEKETKYPVLICATDINEANKLMQEYLRQGLSNLKLTGITKTNIIDVL